MNKNKYHKTPFGNVTHFAVWSNLFAPFIIINQKLKPVNLIKTALVGYRIHENKSVCPSNICFQVNIVTVLWARMKKVSSKQYETVKTHLLEIKQKTERVKVNSKQRDLLFFFLHDLTLRWPDLASSISNNIASLSMIVLNGYTFSKFGSYSPMNRRVINLTTIAAPHQFQARSKSQWCMKI